jgi:hypothetical protein
VNREHHHVSSSTRVDARTVTIVMPPPLGPYVQSVDRVALLPTYLKQMIVSAELWHLDAIARPGVRWVSGATIIVAGPREAESRQVLIPGPGRNSGKGVLRGLIHLSCPGAGNWR